MVGPGESQEPSIIDDETGTTKPTRVMRSFALDDPATSSSSSSAAAVAVAARHKTRYLWQMIIRTVINVMACAIFSLCLYCWIKLDVFFKVTLAVATVTPIYNTVRCVAYLALYRSRPAPDGTYTRPAGGLRMLLSDLFVVGLCVASAALLAVSSLRVFQGRVNGRPFRADPWRLIAFGLQIGAGLLQLGAAIWNWVASKGREERYAPVSNDA